jgi:hypothetical protein
MLFRPENQFMDFFNNYRRWNCEVSYQASHCGFSSIAVENLLLFGFSKISPDWAAFLLYTGIFLTGFWTLLWREVRVPSPLKTLFFFVALGMVSYPVLFAVDRANDQLYYYFLMLGFLAAYAKGRYTLAAVIFGVSLGFKPFQIVFAALFIADKKYRELAIAAGSFAAAITVSALALAPLNNVPYSEAFNIFARDSKWTSSYHFNYVIRHTGLPFGHSAFGALKVLTMHFYNWLFYTIDQDRLFRILTKPYFAIAAAAYVFCAWFIIKKETVFWKRITLLTISMTVLPFVSADYRLLLYFIPIFYFLKAEPDKNDLLYCVLFALIILPKNYYFRIFASVPRETGLGVTLTPAILLYFAWRIIKERLRPDGYRRDDKAITS